MPLYCLSDLYKVRTLSKANPILAHPIHLLLKRSCCSQFTSDSLYTVQSREIHSCNSMGVIHGSLPYCLVFVLLMFFCVLFITCGISYLSLLVLFNFTASSENNYPLGILKLSTTATSLRSMEESMSDIYRYNTSKGVCS